MRKLAAIMFTDIVGYSSLMSSDEKSAMQILTENRDLHKTMILKYNGEFIKEIGDGILSIFQSAWYAVGCAMEIQQTLGQSASYHLRIGIHIGDVIFSENDVFGEGVNIASRLQGICEPGKVYISERVFEDVKNKLEAEVRCIGEKLLKNISHPVNVYSLSPAGEKTGTSPPFPLSKMERGPGGEVQKWRGGRGERYKKPVLILIACCAFIAVLFLLLRPVIIKAIPKSTPTPIAVITFENQTGDTAFNYLQKAIPNLLITNLEQSKLFQVVTWERMQDVIHQLGKGDVKWIDAGLGFEICEKEECPYIVIGSFVRAGDIFVTDAKVLDVATKQILNSVSSKGNGVGSILAVQIDELSKAISRSTGISARKVETANLRIREVTTSSLEAYNYFLKGREAYDKWYPEEARQYFEKAVTIDPGFAIAYMYLSETYGLLQNTQKQNEALENAYRTSSRATENEQLTIRATYAGTIRQDPEQQLKLLLELSQKAPRVKRVSYALGQWYKNKYRTDEATSYFLNAVNLDPDYGEAINQLAYIFINRGEYEKALDYLKKYASLNPGDANPFDSMGDLYWRMGKLDEALDNFMQALKLKPDFYFSEIKIAYIFAMKEDYPQVEKWIEKTIEGAPSDGIKATQYWNEAWFNYFYGKSDQALGSIEKAVSLARSTENYLIHYGAEWLLSHIFYDLGQFELTLQHYTTFLNYALTTTVLGDTADNYSYYYYIKGLVFTRLNQLDSARMCAERVRSLSDDVNTDFNYNYLLREIQIASAQKSADLDRITPAIIQPLQGFTNPWFLVYNTPFRRNSLAEAYTEFGETDKAIREYERLITFNQDSQDRHLINPRYHYYLGILYQQKGMNDKAIKQFNKFLDLWRDADPIFPEPADARKRLERIAITD
jgi:class 3 adenylate cyclase/tetratricopeptide (TPR) repeat protein